MCAASPATKTRPHGVPVDEAMADAEDRRPAHGGRGRGLRGQPVEDGLDMPESGRPPTFQPMGDRVPRRAFAAGRELRRHEHRHAVPAIPGQRDTDQEIVDAAVLDAKPYGTSGGSRISKRSCSTPSSYSRCPCIGTATSRAARTMPIRSQISRVRGCTPTALAYGNRAGSRSMTRQGTPCRRSSAAVVSPTGSCSHDQYVRVHHRRLPPQAPLPARLHRPPRGTGQRL